MVGRRIPIDSSVWEGEHLSISYEVEDPTFQTTSAEWKDAESIAALREMVHMVAEENPNRVFRLVPRSGATLISLQVTSEQGRVTYHLQGPYFVVQSGWLGSYALYELDQALSDQVHEAIRSMLPQ